MKIIRDSGRNFPIIQMTYNEYESLPDYSIRNPVDRKIGDIGKIPRLSGPDERLVEVTDDKGIQIMYCEIIEEN